ncbi:hypothetical protein CLM62_35710 [Streptomyces sp. SA15]|uniref:hypothetical protein n=1 Tax=Streptomyces sp. SA15 TaxID=934019 RepID=UPI000BAF1B8E|nr:hypothetical protein [Streptomyces sp. SA15]PAZ11335.1 hypothetical protein CLM62_35710 [Streptomyces sp. SA15]
MTDDSGWAGDWLSWLAVGAFAALAVCVGVLLGLGTLPKSLLAVALVGFTVPLLRRRWAHWLGCAVPAGTAAWVLLMVWFAAGPRDMHDRLLGIGLPQAGDFAAGVLLLSAALLAGAFALRHDADGTRARSGLRRTAWYAVFGAVTAAMLGTASLAAGAVAVDRVAERVAHNAFDSVAGPAGVPADLKPADHHEPDSGASVPAGFDRAWTARAERAVPLPEVGLAVLCASTPEDPVRGPGFTRLSAVDLDTGKGHWTVSIDLAMFRCDFVVDTEHDAIDLSVPARSAYAPGGRHAAVRDDR